MTNCDAEPLLQLLDGLLPPELWQALEKEQEEENKKGNRKKRYKESHAQIYTLRVVVEMMVWQRLQDRGTQREAVHQLLGGALNGLLPSSKRVREGKISNFTGGYSRACGRVSVELMTKVANALLGALCTRIEPAPEWNVPVLLIDGTGVSLEHVDELLKAFPASRNQYGQSHWGMLLLLVLHDVQTGVALQPNWGPMFGPEAVGEQQLLEQALEKTPQDSIIIGDGNFGVFSVAYAAVQRGRRVLFRLTKQRALSLKAGELLPTGEREIIWRPTRKDRAKHPNLPSDAEIRGRLIVVTQDGFRETFYLFTTLLEPWKKVVALYLKRWNVELDIRTIKCTMQLHHLRGKSCSAVEKEVLMGVVGYGLVRAFMACAARQVGLPPRRLSFTGCWSLLNIMIGPFCLATSEQRPAVFARILELMGKSKLPVPRKQRSCPREVWGFRQTFRGRRHPKPS